ncbi:MAG: adenylate/guanylate cyclase domain-containing protein [Oscillospiraceae bacterium]|nr:adenylate/guanylate cyclase domain-containing protein [Oscillospiraceae bacterium]
MYSKLKILIPVLLLIVFGFIQIFELIPFIDGLTYDYILSSERPPARNIIVVGIDERSINEIGTWPWPRFYMADTISKLTEYDAAAIGISVLYNSYSADEESDMALVAAAEKTDRLVLAAAGYFDDETQKELVASDYLVPFDELNDVTNTGFINVQPDDDGVLRNALTAFKYGDITLYSLPFEVYRTYCRTMGLQDVEVPLNRFGQFPVNYAARPGGYTMVSLWGVINDEYSPAMFKDAIVLIGPYAFGIGDENLRTPLDRLSPTYGVEINANIIQNMLEGSFKQRAAWWLDSAVMAFSALVIIVCLHRLKQIWALVLTVLLVAAQFFAARIVYTEFDIILKIGDCILFIIFCYLANLVLSILAAQNEKHHIQGLFGRFVAPEVVKELVAGGADIQLGGIEKEVTLVFVDIRGFTAFSEANPPEKVVNMVNRYLSLTSRSIQENGGTIDKYIGDATMAVFNAPNDLPDHALCAVKAAWAMKKGSVALREEILKDYGVDLQFGIGINTGLAVVGNMGSDFRMDYTAIGDTVNTAARLESNAQKGQVILSEATYNHVKDKIEVTDLGVLSVKNKKIGIQIYNLENVL